MPISSGQSSGHGDPKIVLVSRNPIEPQQPGGPQLKRQRQRRGTRWVPATG